MDTTPQLLTPRQTAYFQKVFSTLNLPPTEQNIPMDRLIKLLECSSLAKPQLKDIWQLSFKDNKLNRKTFNIALLYITLAQNNKELIPKNLAFTNNLPLPRFSIPGLEYTENTQEENPPVDSFKVLKDNESKYEEYVVKNIGSEEAKKLVSSNAKGFFSSFDLHHSVLAEIWTLCDTGSKGYLDEGEVLLALHFVFMYLKHIPIPSDLQPEFSNFAKEYTAACSSKKHPKRDFSGKGNEEFGSGGDLKEAPMVTGVRKSMRFSTLVDKRSDKIDLTYINKIINKVDSNTRQINSNNTVYHAEMNLIAKKKEETLLKMNDLVFSIKANANTLREKEEQFKAAVESLIVKGRDNPKRGDGELETKFNELVKKMEGLFLKDFDSVINDIKLSDVKTSSNFESANEVEEPKKDEIYEVKEVDEDGEQEDIKEDDKKEEEIKKENKEENKEEEGKGVDDFLNAFEPKKNDVEVNFTFDDFNNNGNNNQTPDNAFETNNEVKFNDDFDF